ncbi:MAG: CopD family protein [Aigarchaeota archaeon]|nr:CopD family protein [Candidatus Pelearchaeum maunauluense]
MGALTLSVLLTITYGLILLAKMSIFLIMVVIGLAITKMSLKLAKGASPEYAQKAQKNIKVMSEINIILGVIVILLVVMLRIGV